MRKLPHKNRMYKCAIIDCIEKESTAHPGILFKARRNILSIHTKDWQPRLTQNFINDVADECVGYCGADIKALCTEATLLALRRRYPQIYASKKKLVLDVNTVRVCGKDFAKAIKTLVPACQRAVVAPGRALSASIRPLLHGVLTRSWEMLTNIFPHALCKTGRGALLRYKSL